MNSSMAKIFSASRGRKRGNQLFFKSKIKDLNNTNACARLCNVSEERRNTDWMWYFFRLLLLLYNETPTIFESRRNTTSCIFMNDATAKSAVFKTSPSRMNIPHPAESVEKRKKSIWMKDGQRVKGTQKNEIRMKEKQNFSKVSGFIRPRPFRNENTP